MAASKLKQLADELREGDDEPTGQHHFHLPKGTTLEADATGKLKAISIPDDEPTPTDAGVKRARVESSGPPSKVGPFVLGWLAVKRMPPWGVVVVVLAAIVAYVILKR